MFVDTAPRITALSIVALLRFGLLVLIVELMSSAALTFLPISLGRGRLVRRSFDHGTDRSGRRHGSPTPLALQARSGLAQKSRNRVAARARLTAPRSRASRAPPVHFSSPRRLSSRT